MIQIEHTANGERFLLQEIPEDSCNYSVHAYVYRSATIGLYYQSYDRMALGVIALPPGAWQILGIAAELSEEQAAEVIERCGCHGFKGYDTDIKMLCSPYAKTSLCTLLNLHNLTPDRTLVLKAI